MPTIGKMVCGFKNPLLLFSSFVSVMKSHISILILFMAVYASHMEQVGYWVGG